MPFLGVQILLTFGFHYTFKFIVLLKLDLILVFSRRKNLILCLEVGNNYLQIIRVNTEDYHSRFLVADNRTCSNYFKQKKNVFTNIRNLTISGRIRESGLETTCLRMILNHVTGPSHGEPSIFSTRHSYHSS